MIRFPAELLPWSLNVLNLRVATRRSGPPAAAVWSASDRPGRADRYPSRHTESNLAPGRFAARCLNGTRASGKSATPSSRRLFKENRSDGPSPRNIQQSPSGASPCASARSATFSFARFPAARPAPCRGDRPNQRRAAPAGNSASRAGSAVARTTTLARAAVGGSHPISVRPARRQRRQLEERKMGERIWPGFQPNKSHASASNAGSCDSPRLTQRRRSCWALDTTSDPGR